jgi:ADP-ribose pyrophosphatase YjhB (NUDIX family)
MPEDSIPQWLKWARELQALGQTGLNYSKSHHDTLIFQRLSEIAAEIMQCKTELQKEDILRVFNLQPGYATVKVDVRGAVTHQGRILLVQERMDQKWCLPGGWADVGEIPSQMVAREVLEESGLQVTPAKLIGVFDANRGGRPLEFFHAYKIVFLCTWNQGSLASSAETMDADFFDFDDLPPLSRHRTDEKLLREVQAHDLNPQRSPAFD